MKTNQFITVIILFLFNLTYAQDSDYKHSVSIIISKVNLGEGDYRGWLYQNQYSFRPFSFWEGAISVGFLTSAYEGDSTSFNESYQAHHFTGDVSLNLIPVTIANKLYFKLGGGFSFRHRREMSVQNFYVENLEKNIRWLYDRQSRWDIGGHLQTAIGINITEQIFLDGKVSLAYYDKGTQVAAFGLSAGYRF